MTTAAHEMARNPAQDRGRRRSLFFLLKDHRRGRDIFPKRNRNAYTRTNDHFYGDLLARYPHRSFGHHVVLLLAASPQNLLNIFWDTRQTGVFC